jgi:hypothetical protein
MAYASSQRSFVKELREYFLRALQAFRFAALPVQGCVGVVEALDATPGEGSDFYRFAGGWASQNNQPDAPGPLRGSLIVMRCQPIPLRTMK